MKKIISLFLVFILATALLPATFAADAASDSIEYIFNRSAYASDINITITNTMKKSQTDIVTGYNKWNIEGLSWVIDSSSLTDECLYLHAAKGRVTDTDNSIILATAIVLNINKTGTFSPSITYVSETSAPKYKIYLAKKNDGTSVSGFSSNKNNADLTGYIGTLTDMKYLGEIDMYGSEKIMSPVLNTVNITETGNYYLILAENGANSNFSANTTINSNGRITTKLCSFTLTPAETQENIVPAFALDGSKDATHSASVNAYAAALDGREIPASVSATDTDGDGIYTVTAPATDTTGEYTFLYWIKGLTSDKANKIVSRTATIEKYKPQNGANYLIAVYEKKGAETEAKAEFYDGNGQLIYTTAEDDIAENNVTVADDVITLPALPRMAKYTSATHWQLYGDATNKKYDAGETETLSGRMIFVAQYDDVNVTVNGDEVRYGDSVTLTADADAEGSYFKWWTRTVGEETEIVSTDRTYTFCPWESCTVSAVYGDTKQIMAGNLRKIIIDVLENDAIMAEFIGLDGAEVVEKGIKLGDKKIAMSTNASQFTITNNISATSASGYAIIKDGDIVTEITDGTAALSE